MIPDCFCMWSNKNPVFQGTCWLCLLCGRTVQHGFDCGVSTIMWKDSCEAVRSFRLHNWWVGGQTVREIVSTPVSHRPQNVRQTNIPTCAATCGTKKSIVIPTSIQDQVGVFSNCPAEKTIFSFEGDNKKFLSWQHCSIPCRKICWTAAVIDRSFPEAWDTTHSE